MRLLKKIWQDISAYLEYRRKLKAASSEILRQIEEIIYYRPSWTVTLIATSSVRDVTAKFLSEAEKEILIFLNYHYPNDPLPYIFSEIDFLQTAKKNLRSDIFASILSATISKDTNKLLAQELDGCALSFLSPKSSRQYRSFKNCPSFIVIDGKRIITTSDKHGYVKLLVNDESVANIFKESFLKLQE
jgi:sugar-specific transcriptional regulator TrmB